MVQILHRHTEAVIAESADLSLRDLAVQHKANLCHADLCVADLGGTDLRGADLCGANLCGANLRGANLRGANLCGANLHHADLRAANLCGANLYGAELYGANLYGAELGNIKMSWRSHDLIAAVLWAAAKTPTQEQLAAWVGYKYEYCWDDWARTEHPEKAWAIGVLVQYVQADDGAPDLVTNAKQAKAATANPEAT